MVDPDERRWSDGANPGKRLRQALVAAGNDGSLTVEAL